MVTGDVLEFEGHQGQALALDPPDDLSDETTLDAVGLDQDEGALRSHGRQPSGVIPAAAVPACCLCCNPKAHRLPSACSPQHALLRLVLCPTH